jgi:hypothetical protein
MSTPMYIFKSTLATKLYLKKAVNYFWSITSRLKYSASHSIWRAKWNKKKENYDDLKEFWSWKNTFSMQICIRKLMQFRSKMITVRWYNFVLCYLKIRLFSVKNIHTINLFALYSSIKSVNSSKTCSLR